MMANPAVGDSRHYGQEDTTDAASERRWIKRIWFGVPHEIYGTHAGLEDVCFAKGAVKGAAKFEDAISKLARFVETRPWPLSLVALNLKAMSTIEAPVID